MPSFPFLLPLGSLYIGLELRFFVAKISKISFKIKIKININYLYSDYEYLKDIGRDIDYLTNVVG